MSLSAKEYEDMQRAAAEAAKEPFVWGMHPNEMTPEEYAAWIEAEHAAKCNDKAGPRRDTKDNNLTK